MIVVKVGGSLYEHPNLRTLLNTFLKQLSDRVVIVPGGGAAADAVREWDRIHNLGEEASHWLAIRAMSLAGRLLAKLLDRNDSIMMLDAESWMREHDTLPHSWDVTSDSIAAHVAIEMNASRLILLKSIDIPHEVSWEVAAAKGWVDRYFPVIANRVPCPIDIINLRTV